jgi:hypothetical protein
MSRAKVGAAVAVAIAILTGAAYVVSTSGLRDEVRAEVESKVGKAQELHNQIAVQEGLDLIERARAFARDEAIVTAIGENDAGARERSGREAIKKYLDSLPPDRQRPDFVAIVIADGNVIADTELPDDEGWKTRFKSVGAALDQGTASKDVWSYGKSIVTVGVAPVGSDAAGKPRAAVVLAYAITGQQAQGQSSLLGTEVAYFHGERLVATSFRRATEVEAIGKATEKYDGRPMLVTIGGEQYLAARAPIPLSFDDKQTSAVVLESLDRALAPIQTVGTTIILLGVGALIVAILAMIAVARSLLHQAEEIETGVSEVINGNTEYMFKPVGADFDGLANSLNVMLARLLGRPEPGEDGEFSEDTSKVLLEDEAPGGAKMSSDPDVVALAQEPEADYYKRLFGEYVEARRAAGEKTDGINFEGFVAKLRLNEANLKKKYQCKAVRFKVHQKGDQVTLKPVPIL